MWIHEDCGGEIIPEDSPALWTCNKCEHKLDHFMWIELPDEEARLSYIKSLNDKRLSEKIREWALKGVVDPC
jgi:hypothetical protein